MDPGSMISAGGSIAGGIMSLIAQGNAQGVARDQLRVAMENQAMQQRLAQQQMELATASRTMPDGSTSMYIPGKGWVSYDGPEVATRRSAQDQLQKQELVRQMTVGEQERNRAGRRRLEEADTASPLLRQFAGGYGMPTRSGVKGKATIAGVTESSEGTDLRKNAASSAALRQGSGTSLGRNLSAMDRAGTAGIRTALAKSDLQGDQMFESMYKAAAGNKLDPYKALTSEATQFRPGDVGGDAATSLNQAATVGATTGSRGSEALARGFAGIPGAMQGAATGPNYGGFAYGLSDILGKLYDGYSKKPATQSATPWNEDSRNDSAYNSWRF